MPPPFIYFKTMHKLTTKILSAAALCSTILLFASCKEKTDPQESGAKAPEIVSCSPENGAVDVEYGSLKITVVYNQNIKISSADKDKVSVSGEASVTSVGAYDASLLVSISGLADDTEYTVSIADGIVKGFKPGQPGAKGTGISFKTKKNESQHEDKPDVKPEPEDNIAWTMASKLGLGWNMGNHFDAFINYTDPKNPNPKFLFPDETCWGNDPCTRATMTAVSAAGFKTIRIPITWLRMIGDAPEYKIDATWMARIKEVVGWARDAGLNVIINTHHDEDHYLGSEYMGHRWLNIMDATTDESVNSKVKEEIAAVWTQIAEEFESEGEYLIFESFNEINDGKWGNSANSRQQARVLNQWNQVFVDAVRATGGNNSTRWLGCPTYCASPGFIRDFEMPEDKAQKLMLAVHCYDPYSFTLGNEQWEQWGHTAQAGKKDQWSGDEKAIRDVLGTIYTEYVSKGIPAYLGEYGCSMRKYGTTAWKFYMYYMEYFVKAAKTYGLPAFLWDNGAEGTGSEKHAYINHGTGRYVGNAEEVIKVMVKAMTYDSPNYTLESVYDKAPVPGV